MIIGKPREEICDVIGQVCDKKDCKLYRKWGAKYIPAKTGKKRWFNNPSEYYAPRWVIWGVFDCKYCKHFVGIDLYREDRG